MLLTSTITYHKQDVIVLVICISWLVHNLANLLQQVNLKRSVSYGLSGGRDLKPNTEWRPLTATIWSRTAPFFRSWLLKRSSGNSCIAEERRKCQSQCTSMLRKRGQTREHALASQPSFWIHQCYCSILPISPTIGQNKNQNTISLDSMSSDRPTITNHLDHWSKSMFYIRNLMSEN